MVVVKFLRHHWLTLGLLIGSLFLVSWIVQTKRPPGAMTPIEAQAMDMTAMKPPPGVFPVAVEAAHRMVVGQEQSFPGEVSAFNDEEVTARVPGLVEKVFVYPGDRVRAGQILATLRADEYGAMATESRLMAESKLAAAAAAARRAEGSVQALARAKADVATAKAALARAEADRDAMQAEQAKAREEIAMAERERAQMQAEARYAEQRFGRAERLHRSGAISLDELQAARRELDSAQAKVGAMEAKSRAAREGAHAADKRASAAQRMVDEASAMLEAALAGQRSAEAEVRTAQSEARAMQAEARSARASYGGTAALASYRELRALSDGEVAERLVSPGTSVSVGQTILRLKVVDRVRVQAELPQEFSSAVREGTPVEIAVGETRKPGKVTSVFPVVAAESRTFRIEALLENPDRSLKPGMYVRVKVVGMGSGEAIAVRASAVRTDLDGRRFVWLVVKKSQGASATDWTCTMHPEVSSPGPGICPKCKMDLVPREGAAEHFVEQRLVTVGATDGRYTAILSGLSEGDQVVWAGFEDLYPRAPVQPTEWGESGPKRLPEGSGGMSGHEGHGGATTGSNTGGSGDHTRHGYRPPDGPRAGPRAGEASAQAAFSCPMHPDVVSERKGSCPKCGMDLVEGGGK